MTLAVFLLAIWSLTLYATRGLRQDMTHLLGEQQFSTTSIITAQLNAELDNRLQALTLVAGEISPALLDNRAALQRFLEQRSTFQKLFNGVNRNHDRFVGGYEGYGVAVNSRGVEELAAAKGIAVAGWLLVSVLPTAEAYEPIAAMQEPVLLAAVVLSLLVGTIGWWLLSRMLRQQFVPMFAASTLLADMSPSGTDRHTTYFNEPWLRFTGQSPAGQLAACGAAGIHPEDLDRCRRTYDSHFDRRRPFRMAYRLCDSDGEYRWIEDVGTPRVDRAGDFIGYVDFCQDISERKRVEGELEQHRHHLEALVAARTAALARAKEAAEAAVPLAPVVNECVALVRPLAEARGISIDADIDDAPLRADAKRLKQVLLNLLANAIKFNREQGTIRISRTRHGGRLRLAVSDSGRGIDSEQRQLLFQPFERLASAYDGIEGTGVGLALTPRLVEAMGGIIRVDSQVDVGSTFSLDLPLANPAQDAAAMPADAVGPGADVVPQTGTLPLSWHRRALAAGRKEKA